MGNITKNTLFYGDNLDILRQYIDDESIDLIYLDPPFNSNRTYNVLFKDESGIDSQAQITAFEDSWQWGDVPEAIYYELTNNSTPDIANMIGSLRQFIGTNQMMAYLVMMAIRLIELHRVLKSTGSLFLHCDPTASHYIKILLDVIFSPVNYVNEIIWRRYGTHNDVGQGSKHFGRVHDVIFLYGKTPDRKFNHIFLPLREEYIKETYKYIEKDTGRRFATTPLTGPGGAEKGNPVYEWKGHTRAWRYNIEKMKELDREGKLYYSGTGYARQKLFLDENEGSPAQDIWDDIKSLSGAHSERLGFQTQKPIDLLERIINSSTEENDLILDPFSGCGTAVTAAQKFNRKWIGIDITQLAIALHKNRLKDMFGLEPKKDYDIYGEPQSLHDAKQLANDNRFQFEWWALSLIEARPAGDKKKGSDKGIDGIITFTDDSKHEVKQVLVQVKSGHVNSGLIRDFRGTIERETNAVMGVFITLENPSKNMETEALEAGYYISPFTNQKHRKIQILTIEELLNGNNPDLPISASFSTFKKAEKVNKENKGKQGLLGI